jgi:hypothetical protein
MKKFSVFCPSISRQAVEVEGPDVSAHEFGKDLISGDGRKLYAALGIDQPFSVKNNVRYVPRDRIDRWEDQIGNKLEVREAEPEEVPICIEG